MGFFFSFSFFFFHLFFPGGFILLSISYISSIFLFFFFSSFLFSFRKCKCVSGTGYRKANYVGTGVYLSRKLSLIGADYAESRKTLIPSALFPFPFPFLFFILFFSSRYRIFGMGLGNRAWNVLLIFAWLVLGLLGFGMIGHDEWVDFRPTWVISQSKL